MPRPHASICPVRKNTFAIRELRLFDGWVPRSFWIFNGTINICKSTNMLQILIPPRLLPLCLLILYHFIKPSTYILYGYFRSFNTHLNSQSQLSRYADRRSNKKPIRKYHALRLEPQNGHNRRLIRNPSWSRNLILTPSLKRNGLMNIFCNNQLSFIKSRRASGLGLR